MTETIQTSLGDLITAIYEEYLALYDDADMASVSGALRASMLTAGATWHVCSSSKLFSAS